jgi:hypothetical protein
MPFPRALIQNYAGGTPNAIYLPIPFLFITTINTPHPLISNLKLAGYCVSRPNLMADKKKKLGVSGFLLGMFSLMQG